MVVSTVLAVYSFARKIPAVAEFEKSVIKFFSGDLYSNPPKEIFDVMVWYNKTIGHSIKKEMNIYIVNGVTHIDYHKKFKPNFQNVPYLAKYFETWFNHGQKDVNKRINFIDSVYELFYKDSIKDFPKWIQNKKNFKEFVSVVKASHQFGNADELFIAYGNSLNKDENIDSHNLNNNNIIISKKSVSNISNPNKTSSFTLFGFIFVIGGIIYFKKK